MKVLCAILLLLFTDVIAYKTLHSAPYCQFDTGSKQTTNAFDNLNLRFEISWSDIKPQEIFGDFLCLKANSATQVAG